jgi:hypothetical protein
METRSGASRTTRDRLAAAVAGIVEIEEREGAVHARLGDHRCALVQVALLQLVVAGDAQL